MLFDSEYGLGLEIVRYNIGGSNTTFDAMNSMRPFAAVPSVISADGSYNWTLVSIITEAHTPHMHDTVTPCKDDPSCLHNASSCPFSLFSRTCSCIHAVANQSCYTSRELAPWSSDTRTTCSTAKVVQHSILMYAQRQTHIYPHACSSTYACMHPDASAGAGAGACPCAVSHSSWLPGLRSCLDTNHTELPYSGHCDTHAFSCMLATLMWPTTCRAAAISFLQHSCNKTRLGQHSNRLQFGLQS